MSTWQIDARRIIFFDSCHRKTGGSAEVMKASLIDASYNCEIHNKVGIVHSVAVKKFWLLGGKDRQSQAVVS